MLALKHLQCVQISSAAKYKQNAEWKWNHEWHTHLHSHCFFDISSQHYFPIFHKQIDVYQTKKNLNPNWFVCRLHVFSSETKTISTEICTLESFAMFISFLFPLQITMNAVLCILLSIRHTFHVRKVFILSVNTDFRRQWKTARQNNRPFSSGSNSINTHFTAASSSKALHAPSATARGKKYVRVVLIPIHALKSKQPNFFDSAKTRYRHCFVAIKFFHVDFLCSRRIDGMFSLHRHFGMTKMPNIHETLNK